MLRACRVLVVIEVLTALFAQGAAGSAFSPEKAGFSVRIKEDSIPYRIFGVFVLPGEKLVVEVEDEKTNSRFVLTTPAGEKIPMSTGGAEWIAPREKGLYHVDIRDSGSERSMRLNIFVMVPYNEFKGNYLNNYHIGRYPSIPFKKLPIYKPPRGFIEVTEENATTRISPHFTLDQFLSKQAGEFPKYVVLRERLIAKLELILETTNQRGYNCDTFHIMSGYRTPFYNKAIGNVKYSRHVYGGAADLFIDENPRDGMMDDLNRDGRIDYQDAAVLYEIIDELYGTGWYDPFVGGLARYKKTASHGPFVHVDVRGFRARWGN